MGIFIVVKQHLYIEIAPWGLFKYIDHVIACLFVQQIVKANIQENSKVPHLWSLYEGNPLVIPLTKGHHAVQSTPVGSLSGPSSTTEAHTEVVSIIRKISTGPTCKLILSFTVISDAHRPFI